MVKKITWTSRPSPAPIDSEPDQPRLLATHTNPRPQPRKRRTARCAQPESKSEARPHPRTCCCGSASADSLAAVSQAREPPLTWSVGSVSFSPRTQNSLLCLATRSAHPSERSWELRTSQAQLGHPSPRLSLLLPRCAAAKSSKAQA